MEQSRLSSFVEAVIGTVIGFAITMMTAPWIYPLFGHDFTVSQNVGIALIFTAISIARGYVVRRWFNARIKRMAAAIASTAK